MIAKRKASGLNQRSERFLIFAILTPLIRRSTSLDAFKRIIPAFDKVITALAKACCSDSVASGNSTSQTDAKVCVPSSLCKQACICGFKRTLSPVKEFPATYQRLPRISRALDSIVSSAVGLSSATRCHNEITASPASRPKDADHYVVFGYRRQPPYVYPHQSWRCLPYQDAEMQAD